MRTGISVMLVAWLEVGPRIEPRRKLIDTPARSLAVIVPERQPPVADASQAFLERHYPVGHWARLWGFSVKTVREWFREEHGPGILRQENSGRRSKRDYTTIMSSERAAARIYAKRTNPD